MKECGIDEFQEKYARCLYDQAYGGTLFLGLCDGRECACT